MPHWFLSELMQEAFVALPQELNVVDAVLHQCQPIRAAAEGEAGHLFRIVPDESIERGIDHAAAQQLHPSGALAHGASRSAAEQATDVELRARFGEREETGTEARFDVWSKEAAREFVQRALQIAQGNVGVHREALHLMEHEGMRGIGIVAAIDL